jgi:hypothetical protein
MRAVAVLALAIACSGPPASDAALCRDVAHRICISGCTMAYDQLAVASDATACESTLLARTGCSDESFKFQSRDNFLSCRAPILRAGDDVETIPDCSDVDDMFRGCPAVLSFYAPRDGGM